MSRRRWTALAALLLGLAALAGTARGARAAAADTSASRAAARPRADSLAAAGHDSLASAGHDSLAAAGHDSLASADTTGNPFVKTPRDTTGAPFHYNTSYSINRNLGTWNQVLNVDTRWKMVHIENTTNVGFREDTQRRQRTGTRTQNLRLAYEVPHGPNVGMALDMERDNDGPIVNGRVRSTSSLSTTGARLTLADSLHLSAVNFLRAGLEGGRASRDESGGVARTGSGSDMVEQLEWTFVPRGPLKLQFTGRNSNAITDAQGQQQGLGSRGQDSTYLATTHNSNKDLNLGGQARLTLPWRNLTSSLNVSHADTRQQQPTLGRQETLTQKTDMLSGSLAVSVTPQLVLNMDANANRNLVLSDVDSSRNYDTRSTGGTTVLSYGHRLLGTLKASLGDRLSISDFRKRAGGNLQDVTEHDLTLNYQRQVLHQVFNLQLNLAARLNSTRYDAPALNQDYLNRRIGGSLSYTPPGKFTMNFQASEVLSHYVYLHRTQSGKNATDRLYSIQYDVGYSPSTNLSLNQTFMVSADANVYDFENYPGIIADNRYTKTTSYVTSLHQKLSGRVTTDVSHSLRLTRSGTYDVDPESGVRLFSESGDGQSNDLQLKVDYHVARWISGTGSMRGQFLHQDGVTALGGKTPSSRQQILEFNLGVTVNYAFSDRARLNGTFSRSLRTDRYTPFVIGAPGTPRLNDQDYFLISASFDLMVR